MLNNQFLCNVMHMHTWSPWGKIEKRKVLEGTILEENGIVQRQQCENCKAINFRSVINV